MFLGSFVTLIMVFIYQSFNGNNDKDSELLETIDTYENAWASGDFLKVETYFSDNAKRFHTEPEVWYRDDIRSYFDNRAKENGGSLNPNFIKDAWKNERVYLDIIQNEDLAVDAFKTDRFKALHIWQKDASGNWKIIYDVGMLNNPCEN